MTLFFNKPLSPTLDVWLCVALAVFALAVPYAVIAVDRLLAHQLHWVHPADSPQPAVWPRIMAGLGGALLVAAFVTLMVLCELLAA